LVGIGSQKV